jgi:hypothetical protein
VADILIQETTITPTFVLIKFLKTLKISEITNDKFTVTNTDTDSVVTNPFNDIHTTTDYDSIGRELSLYWKPSVLSAATHYRIDISGLYDSASSLIDDAAITFTTGSDITQDPDDLQIVDTPVEIEDNSVRSDGFDNFLIVNGNTDFYISSVDPETGEYYLETDYNDGRVTITFSDTPDTDSFSFIKIQRKKIQRAPIRWENLTTEISTSGNEVYIDFPSLDATPLYFTSGSDYFEEGYRYRIKIGKAVANDDGDETLLEDSYIIFTAGLTPLYLDPEEIKPLFPEAPLYEIAEQIWVVSNEIKDLLDLEDDEIPDLKYLEFIKATTACALSKVFDYSSSDELSFRLGDLSVTNRNFPKSSINRGNATTWCELAAALRREIYSSQSGPKAVVKAGNWKNPIPKRRLKRF